MSEFTKKATPETAPKPATTPPKDDAGNGANIDISALESGPYVNWLETWQQLAPDIKDRTKDQVRSILLLKAEVARSEDAASSEQKSSLADLQLAGHHLSLGGSGVIASALLEIVDARLEDKKRSAEATRQQFFSGRAVQMLIIGILVQGGGLAALIYSWSFLAGGIPSQLWGIKTLSVFAVVVSGIAGSLARIVHECQLGIADETTLRNVVSMAATSAARPLLAAVLALFVFALFQSGLIGIPFEATNQFNTSAFAPADFFFVAVAFVIGFNDTLGLNLLAFIGKHLPRQRK